MERETLRLVESQCFSHKCQKLKESLGTIRTLPKRTISKGYTQGKAPTRSRTRRRTSLVFQLEAVRAGGYKRSLAHRSSPPLNHMGGISLPRGVCYTPGGSQSCRGGQRGSASECVSGSRDEGVRIRLRTAVILFAITVASCVFNDLPENLFG